MNCTIRVIDAEPWSPLLCDSDQFWSNKKNHLVWCVGRTDRRHLSRTMYFLVVFQPRGSIDRDLKNDTGSIIFFRSETPNEGYVRPKRVIPRKTYDFLFPFRRTHGVQYNTLSNLVRSLDESSSPSRVRVTGTTNENYSI